MVWRYAAVNSMAMDVSGLEKGSRLEVETRLRAAGMIIVSLAPDLGESIKGTLSAGQTSPEKLAMFFRDFANMLDAGLAVEHILRTFRDAAGDTGVAAAAGRMIDELSVGKSLAEVLGGAGIFPRLAVRAVSAGEKAGNMPVVMGLLADHFDLAAELKGKCLGALVYPVCVLVFLAASFIYVSAFVVPQLAPLLPSQALDDPLTRLMLGLSAGLRQSWGAVLCVGGSFLAGIMVLFRRYSWLWGSFLDALPVIGSAQKDLQVSLCFFDLYILLKSGIPLDAALAEASSGEDGAIRRHLGQCRALLVAGHSFSGALAAAGYFPRLVVDTVRLGEETGRYDDYCARVFQAYRRSFEMKMRGMVAVLHPLMLGICALFVAVMALAFLKPIYANLTQVGTLQP